ncbi:MAG: CPBP family intramembrane glutamic endopeptidase [Patescibacteria group bacterium]|jgi:membrane protease YdiL (CAAX protease family)
MKPLLELLILIILPIILLLTRVIRHRLRFYTLAFVTIAITVVFIHDQATLKDIGIRTDNLLAALGIYLIFTIAGYLFIRWYAGFTRSAKNPNWKSDPHFRYLFIPISLAQQYIFMSFALSRLEEILNWDVVIIIINAVLFALIHITYGKFKTNLPLVILAGLGFSLLYLYFPNLIASSLSHMALNLTAVYFGFLTVSGSRPVNENTEK